MRRHRRKSKDSADDFRWRRPPPCGPWSDTNAERVGGAKPRRHLGVGAARGQCHAADPRMARRRSPPGSDIKHACLSGHSLCGAIAVVGMFELGPRRKHRSPAGLGRRHVRRRRWADGPSTKIWRARTWTGQGRTPAPRRSMRGQGAEDPGYYAVGRNGGSTRAPHDRRSGKGIWPRCCSACADWTRKAIRTSPTPPAANRHLPAGRVRETPRSTSATRPVGGADQKPSRPSSAATTRSTSCSRGGHCRGLVVSSSSPAGSSAPPRPSHGQALVGVSEPPCPTGRFGRHHRVDGLSQASYDAPSSAPPPIWPGTWRSSRRPI